MHLRVSTVGQVEESDSLPDQQQDLSALCKGRGFQIVEPPWPRRRPGHPRLWLRPWPGVRGRGFVVYGGLNGSALGLRFCPGSGRIAPEWVAGLDRHQWPSVGIRGRMGWFPMSASAPSRSSAFRASARACNSSARHQSYFSCALTGNFAASSLTQPVDDNRPWRVRQLSGQTDESFVVGKEDHLCPLR